MVALIGIGTLPAGCERDDYLKKQTTNDTIVESVQIEPTLIPTAKQPAPPPSPTPTPISTITLDPTPLPVSEGQRQFDQISKEAKRRGRRAVLIRDDYDRWFRKYSKTFLPLQDYRRLKAQCYQESRLKPNAKSPVGAQGLCQFMPGTWSEVSGQLGIDREVSAYNPEYSIMAAAYYNSKLRRTWKTKRPEIDRTKLVEASYNAGAGNIIKAQKVCDNQTLYEDIIICLPAITGHHSEETMFYVQLIDEWYRQLLFQ